jgi:hypothetical protein
MEQYGVADIPYSKEYPAYQEKEKRKKEEALKQYSSFLISITNMCFNKCINTDSIYFNKTENKCIDSCFHKFTDLNLYAYRKFREINKPMNFNRAADFGDYYDYLEYLHRE